MVKAESIINRVPKSFSISVKRPGENSTSVPPKSMGMVNKRKPEVENVAKVSRKAPLFLYAK